MSDESSRGGCLTVLLRLIGINFSPTALPYRKRDDFLSAAERSFWGVLLKVVDGQAVLLAKVRVADLLYVPRMKGSQGFLNKIQSKHVDFVLCQQGTMQPVAAIELDDSSHSSEKRMQRDEVLDAAFQAAQLPLLRFRAQRTYDPRAIAEVLSPHLSVRETRLATSDGHTARPSHGIPQCPECQSPMVLRTAAKGPHAGQTFYGCPNYPQCRGTLPAR